LTTVELYNSVVEARGQFCELCHARVGTQLHHVLKRRSKRHPEYDHEINLCLICYQCHDTGYVNSRQFKVDWYNRQKIRGYDVDGWLDSLKLKTKEFYQ